jgi:hypothetical protein
MSSSKRSFLARRSGGAFALGWALLAVVACDTPSEIQNPANDPPTAPTNPVPAHNAVAVPTQPELLLAWTGGDDPDGDQVVFDVFMGSVEPLLRIGTTTARTFTAPSQAVPPQTEVLWQVVARDARGALAEGPIWRFGTASTANRPPTPIAAPFPADQDTAVSVAVMLRWEGGNDPEDGRVEFEVRLDTTPNLAGPELLVVNGLQVREYDPTGDLDPATTYYWQITARDSLGATSQSSLLAFTTAGPTGPPNRPPAAAEAPEPPDGELGVEIDLELGWSGGVDPDGDPVSFRVVLDTVNPPVTVLVGVTTTTAVVVGPLAHTRTYYWQIIAEDSHGARTPGPVWNFSTTDVPNAPPGAPRSPQPTSGAIGVDPGASLTWQSGGDPEGDAVVYDVYFGPFNPPPLAGSTAFTSFDPPDGIDYDTTYFWRVEARDARGGRTSGPLWRFSTRSQNYPPSAPSSPHPGAGLTGVPATVVLTWDESHDPDGDDVTYEVYFGTSNPPVFSGERSTASFDPPGDLAYMTTYRWRIVARDEDGAETTGPLWSFTTGTAPNHPPQAPANPSPPDGATGIDGWTSLDWGAVPDPDGDPVAYDVYFGVTDPPPFVQHQAAIYYDPPGFLDYATTFHWQVVAKDMWGETTPGPVWSFTTGERPNYPPSAPANPNPAHGATGIALEAVMSWSPGVDPDGDPLSYDVFLGLANPPPYAGNWPAPSFDPPGDLLADSHYYWQVLTRDEHGAPVAGPLWEFTTGSGNHAPSAPSSPAPAAGAAGVPISTLLGWAGGADPDGDPVVFDVYLGTADPPPIVITQSSATYDPPADLAYESLYHWRVVARDDRGGETSSPTWTFLTEDAPNQPPSGPNSPDPVNGATGIQPDIVLTWLGGDDPDGDPVTFDVYFGAADPPPLAGSRSVRSFDPPGTLLDGTDYYWRIVARDPNGGEVSGSTWRFTTAP